MRGTALLGTLVLALAGCRGARPAPAPAGVVRSRADTADVLEAVWRVPTSAYTGDGVRWLYLPAADSAAFTVSEAVREALARRGVLASARLPAGHDTIVYQVRRWTRDPTGIPVLALSSRWTRLSASVPAVCMSAGNAETYRVHQTGAGWEAERFGRGIHGVGYCESSDRKP
jgi:hypothetical protein